MIRVRRGPEPQVLKAARRRQRAAAIRAWAGYLSRCLLPRIQELRRDMERSHRATVQERWAAVVRDFFERTAPYQAAAYCALLRWVPEEQRLRWALAPLERPGVVGMSSDESVDQSIDLPEAALYEQLPIEVQLELQAAGGQPGYLVQKVQSCCPLAAPEDIAALLGIQGQRVRTLLAAVAQADDEGA